MTIAQDLANAFVLHDVEKENIWCADIVLYDENEVRTDLILKLNPDDSFNMSEEEYWEMLSKYEMGDGFTGVAVGSRVWTDGISGKFLFTLVNDNGQIYWDCINPFPPTRLDPNHLWGT